MNAGSGGVLFVAVRLEPVVLVAGKCWVIGLELLCCLRLPLKGSCRGFVELVFCSCWFRVVWVGVDRVLVWLWLGARSSGMSLWSSLENNELFRRRSLRRCYSAL